MNLKSRSDYGKNHCELQFVPVVSECNWKLRYQKQKSEDTGKIHRVFALLLEADITLGKVVFFFNSHREEEPMECNSDSLIP